MRTPRFEIFRSPKDEQFYFRLKAKNGKIILSSEGYTQKHNAEGGIESTRTNVLFSAAFVVDYYLEGHGYEKIWVYWFRLVAPNGEIIGCSETYTTKSSARKGIKSVQRCAPIAEIVDLTKENGKN